MAKSRMLDLGIMTSTDEADHIAQAVINSYERLPGKGKPIIRTNGVPEWTVLAGIVSTLEPERCLSLATGVKVQPSNRLDRAMGVVIHDMHAEILALRAFNLFILQECENVRNGLASRYVYLQDNGMYNGYSGIEYNMYVSEIPCGDASLHLLSDGNLDEWTDPPVPVAGEGLVRGRDNFTVTGVVRTKPGRRDSPVSLSKSCTDKLALHQITSMLMGPVAQIIDPETFYLSRLVMPQSQFAEKSLTRAFGISGRMSKIQSFQNERYKAKFFECFPTKITFGHQKTSEAKPSLYSIVVAGRTSEILLNGCKVGYKAYSSISKGWSILCRRKMIEKCLQVNQGYGEMSYYAYKHDPHRNDAKKKAYEALNNWVPNVKDDFTFQ